MSEPENSKIYDELLRLRDEIQGALQTFPDGCDAFKALELGTKYIALESLFLKNIGYKDLSQIGIDTLNDGKQRAVRLSGIANMSLARKGYSDKELFAFVDKIHKETIDQFG